VCVCLFVCYSCVYSCAYLEEADDGVIQPLRGIVRLSHRCRNKVDGTVSLFFGKLFGFSPPLSRTGSACFYEGNRVGRVGGDSRLNRNPAGGYHARRLCGSRGTATLFSHDVNLSHVQRLIEAHTLNLQKMLRKSETDETPFNFSTILVHTPQSLKRRHERTQGSSDVRRPRDHPPSPPPLQQK
jgi:hypothetical protein